MLADALTDAVESGRAKAVGVCNYNKEQLEEIHGLLDKRGIPLACNQVRRGAATVPLWSDRKRLVSLDPISLDQELTVACAPVPKFLSMSSVS